MVEHDDEDRLLRAVTIQNANAILVARRRAEVLNRRSRPSQPIASARTNC